MTAADEHISAVERLIRTIKEKNRCQIQYLPYAKYPRDMVIGCVIFATKSLNNEIGMCKLTDDFSPQSLITGQLRMNYKDILSLSFGEYAEVYTSNGVINTNEECTISTIALYHSRNMQKGWIFMSMNTGRVLHRHQWKKMHINQKIVDRVEELGTKERQPHNVNMRTSMPLYGT